LRSRLLLDPKRWGKSRGGYAALRSTLWQLTSSSLASLLWLCYASASFFHQAAWPLERWVFRSGS
jgi:hypothetical protein